MLGQLRNCEDLRGVIVVLETHYLKSYHFEVESNHIAEETFAAINES